jgi:hypothetical protein
MTQHINLKHGDILHAGFTAPIQELLSGAAPNFRVLILNNTTLKITAGEGDDQQSIAIDGRYRYRTTETTAVLPGGLANGEHPVFVTASDNDFTGGIEEPDKTVHTFSLQIKKTGETPSTAIYRLIGYVIVASEKIAAFRQVVSSVNGSQLEDGSLSGSGDIEWTREGAAWVPQLKANSVGSPEIAAGAVGPTKIATDAVEAKHIAENAVGSSEIATDAVGAPEIAAAAVGASELATSAVEETRVKDAAVTSRKIKITEGEAIYTGGEAWLSSEYAIFASATFTLATASAVHLRGVVHCGQRGGFNNAGQVLYDFYIDGVAQGRGGNFGWEQATTVPGIVRTGAGISMRAALASGSHTITLRARGTGGVEAAFAPTGFAYMVFSQ